MENKGKARTGQGFADDSGFKKDMDIRISLYKAQEIAKDLKEIKDFVDNNHRIAGDLKGLVMFKIDNVLKIFDEAYKRQVKNVAGIVKTQ